MVQFGSFKARWGIGRMHYKVEPGLYAVGTPNGTSPVVVTANYKMSFDRLRQSLSGRNAWVLVLDTKGINVWCAAGKGTFGTTELVNRIESSGLGQIVSHRQLIVPQLAGPGVAAHEVKKLSGFKVIYGPIRAEDLPAFLDAGLKATLEMRRKTFTTWERIVLVPIELVAALKGGLIIASVLFLIAFWGHFSEGWSIALNRALSPALGTGVGIFAGAVLTPALLPWLPGKAFSMKGALIGMLSALFFVSLPWRDHSSLGGQLEVLAWFLLIPALSAFLALNFTGASTFTSLSGVRKEMRWALPLQIGAGTVGFILWLSAQWMR